MLIKNTFYEHGRVSENKAWELQGFFGGLSKELTILSFTFWDRISLCINIFNIFKLEARYCSKGEDHAGLNIDISILTFNILFSYYDIRHWDYDNDCWVKY